jgi:hypothetical protein
MNSSKRCESSPRFRAREHPTRNRLFLAFVVYTSGDLAPTSITHSMNTK